MEKSLLHLLNIEEDVVLALNKKKIDFECDPYNAYLEQDIEHLAKQLRGVRKEIKKYIKTKL